MRFLLVIYIFCLCAFTFVNSDEKWQNQEICETVKFPGGDTAFLTFVYSNLDSKILNNYTDLKGTIYIEFTVDTTGKIINTEIKANRLNIPDSAKIIKEIRRILITSPKWEFYDLVKGDYYYDDDDGDNDFRIDEMSVDDVLPVDDTNNKGNSTEKRNKKSIQKCIKKKVKLIYPFKFPIPKSYLENNK